MGKKAYGLRCNRMGKKSCKLGAGELLITSMDRDGTKKGFDLSLTKKISSNVTVPIIASGGVGKLEDFVDGFKVGGATEFFSCFCFSFWKV